MEFIPNNFERKTFNFVKNLPVKDDNVIQNSYSFPSRVTVGRETYRSHWK